MARTASLTDIGFFIGADPELRTMFADVSTAAGHATPLDPDYGEALRVPSGPHIFAAAMDRHGRMVQTAAIMHNVSQEIDRSGLPLETAARRSLTRRLAIEKLRVR